MTMTKEQIDALPGLVARLNSHDGFEAWDASNAICEISHLIAATVIEQQAEIERLRRLAAQAIDEWEGHIENEYAGTSMFDGMIAEVRAARAALTSDRAATNALGNIAHATRNQSK